MTTKAKTPKYVECAGKTSVLVGNVLVKSDHPAIPASRLNPQHLQTALSAGLLREYNPEQEASDEAAQNKPKPRNKKKAALPFSANPEDLKDLSFEDLLIRCSDEYTASLPKGTEPDEADYPSPEDREAAIAYLTQNHKAK